VFSWQKQMSKLPYPILGILALTIGPFPDPDRREMPNLPNLPDDAIPDW
jgi:hypothetical protein